MLLSEPPPTQGDLHFRAFGFPVRVHPLFWVVAVLLGLNRGQEGTLPAELLTSIAVIFVSILAHELGHAFAQRHFGGRPRITLYGLGGLASCDDCDRSPRSQILISLAGPAAGFAIAAALLLSLKATGHAAGVIWPGQKVSLSVPLSDPYGVSFLGVILYWQAFPDELVNHALWRILWVNIVWGLINLLPIYPLDGGQVAREILTLRQPRRGIILSLRLSAFVAGAMALVGVLAWQSLFTAVMFAYLAYLNYRTLQAYQSNQWS